MSSPEQSPASPREAPVRSVRGERRRREILRCAAELFDERGYHRAQLSEIADAAGIRKTTLYHYFRSKDEILYWLHEEFIELLVVRQEARVVSEPPLTPDAQLLGVIADILDLMDTHRGYVRVFFDHWRELAPEAQVEIADRRKHYERLVDDIVREGIDQGAFRRVDVPLTALALFGMCNWTYQWYDPDGALSGREIAAVIHDLFLHGVSPRAS